MIVRCFQEVCKNTKCVSPERKEYNNTTPIRMKIMKREETKNIGIMMLFKNTRMSVLMLF